MRKKVTVVGGGFVGSTTAQRIHDSGLADVVLSDILDGPPAGKALDMAESAPILGTDARLQRHGEQRHRRDHCRLPAQTGHEPR
jgi:malate dehydrogenase